MSHKLLTLNVRGLNSSGKRRQVFRWLHLQRSDIIFLQETYSSTETIKTPSELKCGFPIWENLEEYWYLVLRKFVFL